MCLGRAHYTSSIGAGMPPLDYPTLPYLLCYIEGRVVFNGRVGYGWVGRHLVRVGLSSIEAGMPSSLSLHWLLVFKVINLTKLPFSSEQYLMSSLTYQPGLLFVGFIYLMLGKR